MKYAKGIGLAVVAALAMYGGVQASKGVGNLYDDWRFLRQARIQALQQQAQKQAAQRQQQASPVNTP